MKFSDYLIESSITDINKEDKIFLLVIGGSASVKNYIYNKNFNIELVDIDAITAKLSNNNFEKARKLISKAIAIANKELETAFNNGKSIAQVSTGSGIKAVQNKFIKAKSFNFKTALVLVDTDINIAIKRNQERALLGKQGLIPDWKVQKTNNAAKETYNKLKNSVDYSTIIKN